jgi:lipopolysaccharide biosynthesis glycosyltransferase
MSSTDPIVLVLAADTNFSKQLAVALAGISKSAEREHQVFVLHDGFDPDLKARLAGIVDDAVDLRWLDARSPKLNGAQLPTYLPTSALFRLRINDLLPDELERVIYIDADVAIRQPLDQLWDRSLDGCAVAAVRDPVTPWAAAPEGLPWSELDLAPETPCLNTGVLVIDTARWRSQQISEQALELLERHRFLNADQCAINAVLAGHWAPVGPRWNLQAGHLTGDRSLAWLTESRDALATAIEEPAIVHFTHPPIPMGRPWEYGCTHPFRDLWFEHLDLTPWAGWRPPAPTSPTRAQMLVRGVRRAGSILARGS